jgi:hypothetical protein
MIPQGNARVYLSLLSSTTLTFFEKEATASVSEIHDIQQKDVMFNQATLCDNDVIMLFVLKSSLDS